MGFVVSFFDVNEAFDNFSMIDIKSLGGVSKSRNGDVYRIPGVIVLEYEKPFNRVLFNQGRDCNHFFHLYESLWMLNGNNDVSSVIQFNKRMAEYSDDCITLNGAYGYRWRYHFGYDQLDLIVNELNKNRDSRRCVLQMWDGGGEEISGDLAKAINGSKDVPCNLCCVFEVVKDKLNMTVFNRSNDIVWGMLGANAVHFSYLHEYISCATNISQGSYFQVSSNCHAYLATWEPGKWQVPNVDVERYIDHPPVKLFDYPSQREAFDGELFEIVSDPFHLLKRYKNEFLDTVARPMFKAFSYHRDREYGYAIKEMQEVEDHHWRLAGINWLKKRHEMFTSKK